MFLRAPVDIRLDWMPPVSLPRVTVAPQDLSGEINLLVAMPRPMLARKPWLLLLFILGQNQTVLLAGLLLSLALQTDLTNHPFSCLTWSQELEQILSRRQLHCPIPGVVWNVF